MSPVPKESVEQVRDTIRAVLGGKASDIFLGRIDAILAEWASGKITAAQACEKVQKIVSLFIGEDLAKEIAARCSPMVKK